MVFRSEIPEPIRSDGAKWWAHLVGALRVHPQKHYANYPLGMQIVAALLLPLSQSSARGAEPALFVATAPDSKPGAYYGPAGLFGLRGSVKEPKMAPFACDDAAAKQLFDQLEALSGVRYEF